jgi:hypothetical protein
MPFFYPPVLIRGLPPQVAVSVCRTCPEVRIAELSSILSTDRSEVTQKRHMPHKIWGYVKQFQRYFAKGAGFSGLPVVFEPPEGPL